MISHKHLSFHLVADLEDGSMGEDAQAVARMDIFLMEGIVVEDKHFVSYLYGVEEQILIQVGCNKGLKELVMLD